MASFTIHLPDEIAEYEGPLRYFMDSMVQKLHVNRHKGFAEGCAPRSLTDGALYEIDELVKAYQKESQFAAYMEAVDVANMMFLSAYLTSHMTREQFDNQRKEWETDFGR